MRSKILILILAVIAFYACGDDNKNTPRGSSAVPAQILNPTVKNIAGASIIYYDRPDDINLRYVKAVYTTDDGITMDATASFFTDSILVQGFRNAGNFQVKVYSVNAAEVMSEPVIVDISPQEPSYLTAFAGMEVSPTFLGIRLKMNNETSSKLAIATYKKNKATGDFEEIDMHFTTQPEISYSIRGQDTIEYEYGVRIRDQWGHWTEQMKTYTITPWFEEELNKKMFKEVRLCNITEGNTGDMPSQDGFLLPSNYWGHFMHWWSGSDVKFEYLWDGQKGTSTGKCYHTRSTGKLPQHFTIDLGMAYSLSRILIWGRWSDTGMGASSNDNQHVFKNGFPKRIQLYGSTYTGPDIYQLHDDIDNPEYWVDLGQYFLRRADGSLDMVATSTSYGTEEDRALLQKGHEFEFPGDAPRVRYFRFRTHEVYNPAVVAVMLGEISLFGTSK